MDIEPWLTSSFDERLPIVGPRCRVELLAYTRFDWGTGLFARLRLLVFDASGSLLSVQESEVQLLEMEHLGIDSGAIDDALDLWVARMQANTEPGVDLSPWAAQQQEELESAFQAWRRAHFPTDERARFAALEQARAEVPRLERHIRDVWGLKPPPLCWLWGFHLRLRQAPARVRDAPGVHLGGIFDRLKPGGWQRQVQPGLDERLHVRFRCDPPEMLTFAWGDSDGGHYGFWFHDRNRYAGVVMNYARDSAETWCCGPSTLSGHRNRWLYDAPAADASGFAARCFLEELAWWEEREAEHPHPTAEMPPGALLGGPMTDPPFELDGQIGSRRDTYVNDPAETLHRIRDARQDPVHALALAHELHWADQDAHRDQAGELLVWAYEALGRHALADIARVHLAHRDLPSVGVLTDPP